MSRLSKLSELQLEDGLMLVKESGDPSLRCSESSRSVHGDALPGQPRVKLSPVATMVEYLRREHSTPSLDRMAPKLWLVSTPRKSHIHALHHQACRGRHIVISENPELHLVWFYSRIYVKPIPQYMLSGAFWLYLCQAQPDLVGPAAGFMRSYSYLIRYQSDFTLATSDLLSLIPAVDSSGEPVTFKRFSEFISLFASFANDEVSPRYSYGELRLTRLNILARFTLSKLTFHHVDAQWDSYLQKYITPILTTFAILTVALSAMQVEIAAEDMDSSSFAQFSRWFSVLSLILVAISIITLLGLVSFFFVHDMWFARKVLEQESTGNIPPNFKSGVI